jgi:hypothetical protein
MKRLLLLGALLLQAGGQPVSIPIPDLPTSPFVIGYGSTRFFDTGVKASDLQRFSNGEYGNGLYVLTFSSQNYFFSYPGYSKVKVWLGTRELCSNGYWAIGPWAQGELYCPASNYLVEYGWPYFTETPPADLNVHVIVSFSSEAGWPVSFDNHVSLTFTAQ